MFFFPFVFNSEELFKYTQCFHVMGNLTWTAQKSLQYVKFWRFKKFAINIWIGKVNLYRNVSIKRKQLDYILHCNPASSYSLSWYEKAALCLCSPEPMWTCYAAFCLERVKRKTNVQELKEKVSEHTARQSLTAVCLEVDDWWVDPDVCVLNFFSVCVFHRGRRGCWESCSAPTTPRCWRRSFIRTGWDGWLLMILCL